MSANRVFLLAGLTLGLAFVFFVFATPSERTRVEMIGGSPAARVDSGPRDLVRDSGTHGNRTVRDVEAGRAAGTRATVASREWALRVWGSVRSADDEELLIAGAEIDIMIVDASGERSKTHPRRVSDLNGAYSFEVQIDPNWRDVEDDSLGVAVELTVWAPGYASEVYEGEVDLAEDDELEIALELSDGAELTGFVFDSKGEPVEADVYVRLDGTEESEATTADENGFYRLDLGHGGVAFVLAREASRGTARLDHITIDPTVRTRVPDMYLSGSGVLGGTLCDPHGEPIVHHLVSLVAEELIENALGDEETWNFTTGDSDSNVNAERGDGVLFGSQRTTASGGFLFEGLRPGRYLLLARHRSPGDLIETPRQLHTTGELDARLVLGVHRLVVTVSGGAPANAVHCIEWSENAAAEPARTTIRPVSERPWTFEVGPGRTYLVGANDGSSRFLVPFFNDPPPGPWVVASGEETVLIEEGRYLTRVALEPEGPRGHLVIQIEDSRKAQGYQVQISSATSGKRVKSGLIGSGNLPLLIELDPGHYQLRIDRSSLGRLGSPFSRANLFEVDLEASKAEYHVNSDSRDVEVRAGGETLVTFAFGAGGRLRVCCPSDPVVRSSEGAGIPIETAVFLPIGIGDGSFSSTAESRSEFELENSRGERIRGLQFVRKQLGAISKGDAHLHNWREFRGALAAGWYVLRWRSPDGDMHEARFEIETGETTSVQFESQDR